MIFKQFTQIICWMLIVNSIKNIQAISFDDIFEYILDGIDDSDESSSSEELTTSNLNVTCKNCNLTVECHNCTQKDTQSTIPMQAMQSSSQDNQQSATSPLPTPTIPAPERVVEILSNNVPTASQNNPPSITTAVTGEAATNGKTEEQAITSLNPKSIENTDQTIEDQANTSTDTSLDSSGGVTSGNEKPTT